MTDRFHVSQFIGFLAELTDPPDFHATRQWLDKGRRVETKVELGNSQLCFVNGGGLLIRRVTLKAVDQVTSSSTVQKLTASFTGVTCSEPLFEEWLKTSPFNTSQQLRFPKPDGGHVNVYLHNAAVTGVSCRSLAAGMTVAPALELQFENAGYCDAVDSVPTTHNDPKGAPVLKKPAKVAHFHVDDWTAVYVDGKLEHWHDTPCLSKTFALVGVSCDEVELPDDMEFNGRDSHPPDSLDKLYKLIGEFKKSAIRNKMQLRKAELAALEKELKAVE